MSTSARHALPRARTALLTRLGTLVVGATVAGAALTTSLPVAHAATAHTGGSASTQTSSTSQQQATSSGRSGMTARQRFTHKADRVLRVARAQRGDPYRYGADGPNAFDCSGLVLYTFKKALGRSLPHNAAAQYARSKHISRRHLRRGDLVFVDDGGYIDHVGIYAGHGYWWVAPHTGTHVQRQKIYPAHHLYGRLIRS